MHLKFDFSGYKMSCMSCLLLSNRLTSVIYYDSSSFQVHTKLFHFDLMCMRKTLELKNFC